MTITLRRTLVALVALLALTGCGAFQDADDFVSGNYTRAATLDQGTARAFTAAEAPSVVQSRISKAVRPLDTISLNPTSYLQYKQHLVRVAPPAAGAAGSVIFVDNYANGYRRWAGDVASRWGLTPSDGDGDDDGK